MPIARKNYRPPAGSVIDQNEPRASWNGKEWRLNNKKYNPPSSHRLIGKPGGTLSGWYYDWKQRAWMEPDRAATQPPRPGGVARPPMRPPTTPARPPLPRIPTTQNPALTPGKELIVQKDPNVLEYLVKHPIAPLVGGFLVIGSMMADEPTPPQIPEGLPEPVAKQWQMIYAQNLQRFQRRQAMWETAGKVLLGYAEANAIVSAVTAPPVSTTTVGIPRALPRGI